MDGADSVESVLSGRDSTDRQNPCGDCRRPETSAFESRKHGPYGTVLFLLLCIVVQELVLRLLFPLPEDRWFNRVHYVPTIGGRKDYRAIRSIDIVWHSEPDGVSFVSHLNYYGFRDVDWTLKRRPGYRRVAFVGDSFTEGLMAPGDRTIPAGFAAAARCGGRKMESMNFGIGGTGPKQYFPLAVDLLPLFRPDLLVMVFFANDLGMGCEPEMRSPARPTPWPGWRPRLLELVGMLRRGECLPARYHFIERPFFWPLPNPGNPWNSFLPRVRIVARPDIATAVERGRFAPMRIGGPFPFARQLTQKFDLEPALSGLSRCCSLWRCRLFVVYIPDRSMVTSFYRPFDFALCGRNEIPPDMTGPAYRMHARLLARQCRRASVPMLDLTPWIERRERAGEHLYWYYDDHMRGFAYQSIGKRIFDWIRFRSGSG